MTQVTDYQNRREEARKRSDTLDYGVRYSLLSGEQALFDGNLIDMKKLNKEDGVEAYMANFESAVISYAKKIYDGNDPNSDKFDLTKADIFQKAAMLRGTTGITLNNVRNQVNDLGSEATSDQVIRRLYRDMNEAKTMYVDTSQSPVKYADKDVIIDEIDQGNKIVAKSKVRTKEELLAIMEEYYANQQITPKFIDEMKRKGRDLFN
jgi:hypothetical protein